jgi:F-type H+-transporting ATPase subunit gamma
MAILRDIRRRIVSVRNTRQITSAMKMVSAAKLNRASNAVKAAQPYSATLRRMVSGLHAGLAGEKHPLFAPRSSGKSVVILFTSDRGLCGNFNNNLSRFLLNELRDSAKLPDPELIVFGRKGNDFFKRRGFSIGQSKILLSPSAYRQEIADVTTGVVDRYLAEEIRQVHLAYNYFHSPIRQEPVFQQLLPVPPLPQEAGGGETREILFEPERQQILDHLLPAFLRNQTFVAHLNTEAGEHGARMVAMEGATKNAGEMINRLTLTYNRARQAAITKELIEIVNAAQAM